MVEDLWVLAILCIFVAMKAVFLIGYMGCGKTTQGESLARLMGRRFVDLDVYIEERCGMSAKEIFAAHGEAYFRRLEREALKVIAAGSSDVVVACGGGTPLHRGNMALMNRVGITVWLTTNVDRITSRLVLPDQRSKRPLLNQLTDEQIRASVIEGLEARKNFYSKAQLQFDSTFLESVEEIAATAQRLAAILQSIV